MLGLVQFGTLHSESLNCLFVNSDSSALHHIMYALVETHQFLFLFRMIRIIIIIIVAQEIAKSSEAYSFHCTIYKLDYISLASSNFVTGTLLKLFTNKQNSKQEFVPCYQ